MPDAMNPPNPPHPPDIPAADLERHFTLVRQPIAADVFELGLALGGTVSAGAYTAGVLDYLIEALDAWTRAKEDQKADVPRHKVVVSTLAGASGGAINGCILLRASSFAFPHGAVATNPFWQSWQQVDLKSLLSSDSDNDDDGLYSVLNTGAIEKTAASVPKWTGLELGSDAASPRRRSYLADPLRLMCTVSNVTGVPYRIKFEGQSQLSHDLVAHADLVRFARTVRAGAKVEPQTRDDEYPLGNDDDPNWQFVGDTALATSAFPLAFRSRPLERAPAVFGYRAVATPGTNTDPPGLVQLVPLWDVLADSQPRRDRDRYRFVNVDGGATNNEPIDLVRTALAGLAGRNERDGASASRATILIDPFSDPESLGPVTVPPMLSLLMPFVMSLVYQARFKPEDLALARDESVFSRFLVAPVGNAGTNETVAGAKALASGGLGGFLGFFDKTLMDYDFKLGRWNAYKFLSEHLAFPETNTRIFGSGWTADQMRDQTIGTDANGNRLIRLIPLMQSVSGDNAPKQPQPNEWPSGLATDWVEGAISDRLDRVYSLLRPSVLPSGWSSFFVSPALWSIWKAGVKPKLLDLGKNAIINGLQAQGLIASPLQPPPPLPAGNGEG